MHGAGAKRSQLPVIASFNKRAATALAVACLARGWRLRKSVKRTVRSHPGGLVDSDTPNGETVCRTTVLDALDLTQDLCRQYHQNKTNPAQRLSPNAGPCAHTSRCNTSRREQLKTACCRVDETKT